MAVRLSAWRGGRPLPPGKFLILISLRGWVDRRPIVRLEGLGQLKNPVCYRPPYTVNFCHALCATLCPSFPTGNFCHALGTTFLSNRPLPGCWWTSLITALPFPVMLLTFSVLSTNREKSGVAGFCSVMVLMSSYLGSYGPSSGRAGGSLCNSHVHHLKTWHFQ
jgi:hypothetical protein